MWAYVIKRLLSIIPVLIGISIIAFALGLLTPGDPAAMALSRDGQSEVTEEMLQQKREELGLDEPAVVQYLNWVSRVLHGDLGESYADGSPVVSELIHHLPVTLRLSGWAMLLVCIFGILSGLLAAAFAGRVPDKIIQLITNVMLAFPSFWLAIILIIIFAENLKLLPTNGVGDGIHYMVLPAVTLASATIAMTERLMRSSVLSECAKQYMVAANAKGISGASLILKHAFPNAVLPVITLLGNYLGGILGGSAIVESVFSLPGIGSCALDAIHARDYPMIQGYVLVTGTIYVLVSLAIDLLCAFLNPRLRIGGEGQK